MSKCTASQAVAAMTYWVGYYEKASSSYASSRAKSSFTKNKGSGNYTYAGYLCGVQGQAWCAAQVSTAIYEACGSKSADAKSIMYGVWPYVNCAQVWDAAPSSKKFWSYYQRFTLGKGSRTNYKPKAGDIIVFTDNKVSRSHTGMVYAVDSTYVYTIEGNSGNMCRKRSYKLTDGYIYGWIRPNYAESSDQTPTSGDKYGVAITLTMHQLDKGCAGEEVETLQRLLNSHNRSNNGSIFDGELKEDGIFGTATEAAVIAWKNHEWPGSTNNGVVGPGSLERLYKGTR